MGLETEIRKTPPIQSRDFIPDEDPEEFFEQNDDFDNVEEQHPIEPEPEPEEHPIEEAPVNTSQQQRTRTRPSMPEGNYTYVTDDTAFVSKNYLGIDPATGLIEVFVHLNKNENFILYRTDTIATLKQMITERNGIPIDIQRLIFAGRVLQNDTTLAENKIMCGSNIHLFIRLRGGVLGDWDACQSN